MSLGYATSKGTDVRTVTPAKPILLPDQTVNPWTRPADWLTLPTVTSTDQKLVGLVGVADDTGQFLAINCSVSAGTYTVDWGDGTVLTYASGTQANYQYTYGSISSTVTSKGYKQVIVQVYPTTGGATFSNINTQAKYTNSSVIYGTLNAYSTGWFDMVISAPNATSIAMGGTTVFHTKLEQFQLLSCGAMGAFELSYCYNLQSIPTLNFSGSTSVNMQNMFYNCYSLVVAPTIQWNKCSNAFQMFYQCYSLGYVPDATTPMSANWTGSGSVTRFMFYGCSALKKAPWLDTSKSWDCQNMFQNCGSLVDVPEYDFSISVGFSGMFNSCYSLTYCPPFKTSSLLLNTGSMFSDCWSLESVAGFETSGVTNMGSMFNNCYGLVTAPLLNTANVTNMNTMFYNCSALRTIPQYDTTKVITMISMFYFCKSLQSVPLLNTANVTNMGTMFQGTEIFEVPVFNTANVTDMNNMFQNNRNMQTAPAFDTTKVITMAAMYNYCYGLKYCPDYNTANVTNMSSMFSDAQSLVTAPNFNTVKVTNMSGMFQSCKHIATIPTYDTANVTDMNSMFNNCESLQYVPTLNTVKVTNFSNFTTNTRPLEVLPALNMANATTLGTIVGSSAGLGSMLATGMKVTYSVASQKLGRAELETMFTNTAGNAVAQTCTITSNWGADTAIATTGTYSTFNNTMTVASATNLIVGMYAYGASAGQRTDWVMSAINDNITTAGGTVANGTKVSFSVLSAGTGLTLNTIYYAVNSSGTTFQIALTPGGAPIDITTSAGQPTGTIRYEYYITNIAGTTLTMNAPATVAGTSIAVSFRRINTHIIRLKNWNVTG